MKKILYVEDDVLIANLYSQKLAASGFEVVVARDGLAAVRCLRESVPDLVVLDLLMPKLTGVDVLKFMRQHPALKNVRVIVFSNSFLSDLVEQVAKIGVEEALVKSSVTPVQLMGIINQTLENPQAPFLSVEAITAHLSVAREKTPPAMVAQKLPEPLPIRPDSPEPVVAKKSEPAMPSETRAQKDFLEKSLAIFDSVRKICQEFLEAGDSPVELRKLEDLRRKIGFVIQTLGITGRFQLAQLCSALQALLFELEDKPAMITH